MALRHPKGDLAPSWTDTILLDGAAPGSTFDSASVKFQAHFAGSQTLKIDAAASFVSSTAGTVQYDPVSADVDTEGDLIFWWLVTLSSGDTLRTPQNILQITPPLGRAAQLCEVEEVRALLRKDGDERGTDAQIERLVIAASEAIVRWTGREFAPTTEAATRSFGYRTSGYLSLSPYDLRSVDSITIDPDLSTEAVLVAGTDYRLEPTGAHDGVYEWIEMLTYTVPDVPGKDGHRTVEVVGDWGWPSVPADVRYAAAVTAATWHRSYVAVYSQGYAPDEALLERPESLSLAVRRLLDTYRRGRFG